MVALTQGRRCLLIPCALLAAGGAPQLAEGRRPLLHRERNTLEADAEPSAEAEDDAPQVRAQSSRSGAGNPSAGSRPAAFQQDAYCPANREGDRVGCARGCGCGFASRCYPRFVLKEDVEDPLQGQDWVNIGVCDIDMRPPLIVGMVLFIGFLLGGVITHRKAYPLRPIPFSKSLPWEEVMAGSFGGRASGTGASSSGEHPVLGAPMTTGGHYQARASSSAAYFSGAGALASAGWPSPEDNRRL